jgi:methyltransferase
VTPRAIDSRVVYTVLVAAVAAARLAELRVAEENRRRLLARGAVEAGARHYPAMVALHAAWLLACPAEVWLLGRPLVPPLAAAMLGLLAAAMALRYWVIATLGGVGGRWTTRILVLPGVPPIETGPFRHLRHPNYLAVAVEILALPLVHTAWLTAGIFTAANAALLAVRIRAEERALAAASNRGERRAEGAGGRPERRRSPTGHTAVPPPPPVSSFAAMNDRSILAGIAAVAREHLGWEGPPLTPEMRLVEDLRLDSIRLLTLAAEVENRFQVMLGEEDEQGIETVGDLVSVVRRKLGAG